MLCNVCLGLVSKLFQLQREGRTSGAVPVRELIQTTGSEDGEMRQEGCSLCEATLLPSASIVPPFEDLVIHFKEHVRLEDKNLNFYFDIAPDRKFFIERADQKAYDLAMRCRLSSSTGSESSMDLAAHWFRDCLHNHKRCNARRNSAWYPRRLLDVSGTNIRLISTADDTPDGPYTTMSHCWGQEKFLVLTAENMEDFLREVPLASLLPSFRDAISVIRHLGLRYIWIDCFCIVQDSESGSHNAEKLIDIAQMREVYANSILNIGASYADNPRAGCFVDRQKAGTVRPSSEYLIPRSSDGQEDGERVHFYDSIDAVIDSQAFRTYKLFERAWVFQERVLCPRMLHFGYGHLYWECQEIPIASETFPCGQVSVRLNELFIFNILDENIENWDLDAWTRAVDDYSAMELSKPTEDKLVAIGGIAQAVSEAAKADYFAGFLSRNLLGQLCWRTMTDTTRAQIWRAPSWSWASVDNNVFFSDETISFKHIELAHVEKVNVELVDPGYRYGAVKSASVVLIGRLLETSFLSIPESDYSPLIWPWVFSLPGGNENCIHLNVDDEPNWPVWKTTDPPGMDEALITELRSSDPRLYILPLVISITSEHGIMSVEETLAKPTLTDRDVAVEGLLVQKVSPDAYVRRGCIASLDLYPEDRHRDILLREWMARQDDNIIIF